MKIKNNTKNLIPRHLTGGLVRKYQLAAGSRGIERYKPTFTDRIVLMSRNTPQNRAVNSAIVTAANNTGLPIRAWPKYTSITNKKMTTWPDGETTMYINDNKDSIGLDGTIYNNNGHVIGNDGIITTASKPAQNLGTQGKPAGTKGSGTKGSTRGSGTRGNARTTAKPATTTFTDSPTNITDQGWLDARNAAMRRGWGTYNYNGLTYRFTGDEFLQAKRNWNNRRKAGYQAEGILNLPGITVPDNLVIDNNEAREIESTIPLTQQLVKPIDTKTTPYTFLYQLQLTNNPNLTRDMLWQATQDVRNGKRNASYYGENSDLVSKLANDNQDSVKNYIYNLWNTNNDVATQAGRKNYTESQGLIFGEPTINNVNKDSLLSWATDFLKRSARQGTKLIRRK